MTTAAIKISIPLAFLCLTTTLSAQIFVKANATGNQNGASWQDAFTDLQSALAAATLNDQIWVAAGTYLPGDASANPDSTWYYIGQTLSLYGGFAGTESSIDERDIEANPTILSGDLMQNDIPGNLVTNREDNCMHVVVVDSTVQAQATLDGFIIKNGHANTELIPDPDYFPYSGGAVIVYNNVALKNCTFLENYASYGGAVECLVYPPGQILVENCTFQGNRAWDWGGALAIQGQPSECQILNCTFDQNTCGRYGGALLAATLQTFEITGCAFTGNQAGNNPDEGWGGAAACFNPGSFYFTGCTFTGNTANSDGAIDFQFGPKGFIDDCVFTQNLGEFGGAVGGYSWLESDEDPVTTITITNSEFHQNTATLSGGALLFTWQTSGVVENCLFTENIGQYGGGIGFAGDPDFGIYPTLSVNACYFESNSGGANGGAISLGSGKDVLISNSLFLGNSDAGISQGVTGPDPANLLSLNNTFAFNEQSIYQTGNAKVTLQNTILHNLNGTNLTSSGSNVEWESLGGNLSNDLALDDDFATLTDKYGIDPLFVSESDLHLTENSPCVDAGNPDGVAALYDLEGNDRFQGNGIDIGAYESPFINAIRNLKTAPGIFTSYPNPCKDEVNLRIENDWTGQIEVQLLHAEGKVLRTLLLEKWEQQLEHTLQVSDLMPGMYWISLKNGEQKRAISFTKF